MAPDFLQATPDAALRFLRTSAVNRRVASSNLARGAKILLYQAITEFGQSIRLATECLGLRSEIAIAQVAGPKSLFESPTEDQQALS